MAREVKRLYRKIAKKYAKEYWGKASPYDKHIAKFLSLLPKGGKILDAGCGVGDSVDYFLKLGFRSEGIDISPAMLTIARRKVLRGKFRLMDIRRLGYGPKNFDAVYCLATLEHIPKTQIAAF